MEEERLSGVPDGCVQNEGQKAGRGFPGLDADMRHDPLVGGIDHPAELFVRKQIIGLFDELTIFCQKLIVLKRTLQFRLIDSQNINELIG